VAGSRCRDGREAPLRRFTCSTGDADLQQAAPLVEARLSIERRQPPAPGKLSSPPPRLADCCSVANAITRAASAARSLLVRSRHEAPPTLPSRATPLGQPRPRARHVPARLLRARSSRAAPRGSMLAAFLRRATDAPMLAPPSSPKRSFALRRREHECNRASGERAALQAGRRAPRRRRGRTSPFGANAVAQGCLGAWPGHALMGHGGPMAALPQRAGASRVALAQVAVGGSRSCLVGGARGESVVRPRLRAAVRRCRRPADP
jgi:hypothetical protein